jgi:hypothetical protein
VKKISLALAVAAIATMAVVSSASADVARYQPAPKSATFTVTSPMAPGDWQHAWIQDYTVTMNTDGATFSGTGNVHNNVDGTTLSETVDGSFTDTTVTFTAVRPSGFTWSLINAPFDGTTVTDAQVPADVPWKVEMTVSPPKFTGDSFKNHGDYVSSQGGGSEAAHSPIGMPVNSKSGK